MSERAKINYFIGKIQEARRQSWFSHIAFVLGFFVAIVNTFIGQELFREIFAIALAGYALFLIASREHRASKYLEQLKTAAYGEMRACPKCGKEVLQGSYTFCPFCGASMEKK